MKKILNIGLIIATCMLMAGCKEGTTGGTAVLFGEKPIETGQSDIAPTGSEYELLFNKEVTNCHNAIVSVLSLNNTGDFNSSMSMNNNDILICNEAINTFSRSYNAIDETLPAKGWEEKKERFLNTIDSIINVVKNSIDDKKLDTNTLNKLEVGLSALTSNDSSANSLNL